MRTWIRVVAAIAGLAIAISRAAQQAARCQTDAMGETRCARLAGGSAVLSGLGEVVCAPGQCAQDPQGTDWQCSAQEGGWATWDSNGPSCQGGCVPPSADQCRRN
jgi:homogentisate 1,2-dioxygenase